MDARKLYPLLVAASLLACGCFPSKTVTLVEREALDSTVASIEAPTKVHLLDASVILFPRGFRMVDSTLVEGQGRRYWIDRSDPEPRSYQVPVDSIAAMTYYDLKSSYGTMFGSILLGLWGGIVTPLSIHCISCPKCCFGSCPTVYTGDPGAYRLEAELFSYALSRFYQEDDLDRLAYPVSPDGSYQLRLTNEALETHYIDRFSLVAVSHPPGTEVFPSPGGGFIATGARVPPSQAFDAGGRSVLDAVRGHDEAWFRSDPNAIEKTAGGIYRDWIDLTLNVPPETDAVKLVLRVRNTLLSTVLFYDLVLGSQGIEALEWTERLNTDSLYAAQYHALYLTYAGIDVKVERDGRWTDGASLGDIGPIAWKYVAVELPVEPDQAGAVQVRLEFFPDNFMIDYVGYEAVGPESRPLAATEVLPTGVIDNAGNPRPDVLPLVAADDDRFLVTGPGESYRFTYRAIPREGMETTTFIRSKGYYTEWIRGDWIKIPRKDGYTFDLFQVSATLDQLRKSWQENRPLMEQRFFETRIPIREEL